MKTATYRLTDGTDKTVEYDETAPCILCGLSVVEASMGGTIVCPWCDCGTCRFDPSHRVDTEWDHETGKIALPVKHYQKWHADARREKP